MGIMPVLISASGRHERAKLRSPSLDADGAIKRALPISGAVSSRCSSVFRVNACEPMLFDAHLHTRDHCLRFSPESACQLPAGWDCKSSIVAFIAFAVGFTSESGEKRVMEAAGPAWCRGPGLCHAARPGRLWAL
jgi:hypothetical protein